MQHLDTLRQSLQRFRDRLIGKPELRVRYSPVRVRAGGRKRG